MKYLIAGLGNIGADYEGTRHNMGFDVLDQIAALKEVTFEPAKLAQIAKVKHRGRTLILIKPSTYVNRSGKAVRYWLQKEKIPSSNLLVVVDDVHLDFGRVRLRGQGNDGGHNGLKDIIAVEGKQFARLRIGIGRDYYHGEQSDYVLGKWSEEQLQLLPEILDRGAKAVLSFVSIGLSHTMNQFNN